MAADNTMFVFIYGRFHFKANAKILFSKMQASMGKLELPSSVFGVASIMIHQRTIFLNMMRILHTLVSLSLSLLSCHNSRTEN